MKLILNIQALRALAALMVVVFHLDGVLRPTGIAPGTFAAGSAGVDIFFVISGFVMVNSVLAKPITASHFMKNRTIRVVPLYWIVTIALSGIVFLMPNMIKTVSATPVEVIKSILFIPYHDIRGEFLPVLPVGWTLNYEMFFYLIFGAALLATKSRAVESALLSGAMLFGFVVWGQTYSPTNTARFFTDPIIAEFGFGMALGLICPKVRPGSPLVAGLLLALGLLAIFAQPHPAIHRAMAWGLPAAAIVYGAIQLDRTGITLKWQPIQTIGAASYALYLLHPLIIAVGLKISALRPSVVMAVAMSFAIIVFSVIAAIATHGIIEQPIMRWFKRRSTTRQAVAASQKGIYAAPSTGSATIAATRPAISKPIRRWRWPAPTSARRCRRSRRT